MFKFITKKYEDKIEKLENQIKHMTYEWNKEKELYGKKTRKRFYEQKVDWVIGGLDVKQYKEIHRPMYGLTENDAFVISGMVEDELKKQGIICVSPYHWDEIKECYVVDVKYLGQK